MPSQSRKSTASPSNHPSSASRPQRSRQPPSKPGMLTPSRDSRRRLSDSLPQPSPGPSKRKRASSSVTIIDLEDDDDSVSNDSHPSEDDESDQPETISKKKGKFKVTNKKKKRKVDRNKNKQILPATGSSLVTKTILAADSEEENNKCHSTRKTIANFYF
ncbi:uncharacterized protein MELLADRAFT_70160 [Melampsora larici-populina 98AG31]|uniref:Uncharacterized protein n=1 Tax=Melampsora larici-populina (strain 98AG31 / pathotype 3-4-7) TaxID=747676 RepID=F4SDU8_MELLP|nr:uncharacterized protein MELLADRAFT_70160 [Melampsora larici-populina 98AG31]EGF97179.1 hypothetical protein MELLADRAFT_70160 [Melampsora larici-populina 98AG31]